MLARRASVAIMALAAWGAGAAARAESPQARADGPEVSIPLEPMGYQTLLPQFLNDGSSMVSVDYVDKDHLLVTFGVRHLLRRDPKAPADDDDRLVDARLIEIPSGKVLAGTEWQLHDHGQYLWPLGHGRFLFRMRDQLTMLEPMRALTETELDGAFHQYPFLHVDRKLVAIEVSPDEDLLTIESTAKEAIRLGDAGPDEAPVQVNFYRLREGEDGRETVSWAGAVRTRGAVDLPLTTAGYLEVLEGDRDRWLFNFDSFAGPVSKLAGFDTSCRPRVIFVSHSEFIAFGCRGSIDRQEIGGFNLEGDAMWQQNFYDSQLPPTFAFAPATGRFAMERTIVSPGSFVDPGNPAGALADVVSQEVRVYQTYSGKVLFAIGLTPMVRAGQNYTLSPDGQELAVLRETLVEHKATRDYYAYTDREAEIEIYALPPLSGQDAAAVKEAQATAPKDSEARIDEALARIEGKGTAEEATPESNSGVPGGGAVGDGSAANASGDAQDAPRPEAANGQAAGDPQEITPRKRPTLYAPGEEPKKQ